MTQPMPKPLHSTQPLRTTCLDAGWQLAEVPAHASCATIALLPDEAWLTGTVPGSNYGSLLQAGRIPDPAFGCNEADVRWVGERTWAWRKRFDVETLAAYEELVFDGLDTYCTVWLNGAPLLESDNMFVPARCDLRGRLRIGSNELLLRFDPPRRRGREQEAALGRRHLWNGDSSRLYVRKAQYHYGWDWGPELLCSGPWRPVSRASFQARIADLHCRSEVNVKSRTAGLTVCTRLAGSVSADACIALQVFDPQGRCVAEVAQPAVTGEASLNLADVQLWWPNGMGTQPLYTLVARLFDGEQELACEQRRLGLRTLRLVQEPVQGEGGLSFCFEVNGQDFFTGGANWIPDDNLLERITPARYRLRVAQAAEANMNMLRVWGGGIYEHDAFYEACDELGVLVWQDFMFACGMYPAHDAFRASVQTEAEAAVRRLRHHACLALWCGNNEDYAIAESVGAHGPAAPGGRFDARVIYEQLLPQICTSLDPDRPYWPGSPYSPSATGTILSGDATVGDRHSWEVWHQQMLPYQRYGEVQARFVSEFGMQSHPALATLEAALPVDDRFPESRSVMWHNKAGSGTPDGHRRLAVYMADNLCVGPTLAEHVYATQFVQAEAMRVAYQNFRRRWQRPGARAVGGALVWQLNDCWPTTSWALIDSSGIAKPAWHTVRRALAPLAVAVRLETDALVLAACNGNVDPRVLELSVRVLALDGRCLFQQQQASLLPGSTSQETRLAYPGFAEPVVAELCAYDARDGSLLARDCAWTEPFKFYRLGTACIQVERCGSGLSLSTDIPVKGLWLQDGDATLADNFLDLLPGAPLTVPVRGDVPQRLKAWALDMGSFELDVTCASPAEPLGTPPVASRVGIRPSSETRSSGAAL